MRSVKKSLDIRPYSLRHNYKHFKNAVKLVVDSSKWYPEASKLYGADSVREMLDLIYNGKCCYCEIKVQGSPLQVEHYRPKDKVRESPTHTGYYWLAYEWTNLLFACSNCNSRKSNQFPLQLELDRVFAPVLNAGIIDHNSNRCHQNPLISERPLLVHPELEDCTKHFQFSFSGELIGIGDRGAKSIEICDLNRDELFYNGRKKIIDSLQQSFLQVLRTYVEYGSLHTKITIAHLTNTIQERIIVPILEEESFTQLYKTILLNFDLFFIDGHSNEKCKSLLRIAYYRAVKNHIWVGKSSRIT